MCKRSTSKRGPKSPNRLSPHGGDYKKFTFDICCVHRSFFGTDRPPQTSVTPYNRAFSRKRSVCEPTEAVIRLSKSKK